MSEKYPKMNEILTRAAKPGNWLAIITLILEFLGPMLDGCFDEAEDFAEAARDPNRFQRSRIERRAYRALRNDGRGVKESLGLAMRAVDEGCHAFCEASEDELVACFREFKA